MRVLSIKAFTRFSFGLNIFARFCLKIFARFGLYFCLYRFARFCLYRFTSLTKNCSQNKQTKLNFKKRIRKPNIEINIKRCQQNSAGCAANSPISVGGGGVQGVGHGRPLLTGSIGARGCGGAVRGGSGSFAGGDVGIVQGAGKGLLCPPRWGPAEIGFTWQHRRWLCYIRNIMWNKKYI